MQLITGRLLRFGLVGCIGIGIDFLVTWICKEQLKSNKFAANAAGFTVAVASNYFLNRLWTFKNSNPAVLRQFFLFVVVSLIGLLFNTGILYLLHEKNRHHFYLSKIAAIGLVFCWNYFANSLLTFHS